ncbi:acyl-CoA dehydrogenase family protein [Pseudofrankia asymbiotica]|uniref:Acyl-CoA dehydrogenase n=1 Tax=Pseudofrankia asymbiotica TaxID=1834516 RepID=A0A1V2I1U5_9ACTN|nr:acyl-CoA dehydrogenase family protein [Pseudofrankia asymbiotica]ONH23916.1 hypothetical protein BL253_31840 [Pseudofrankia asymbiotica]
MGAGTGASETALSPDEARTAARAWLSDHWAGVDDENWRRALVTSGWAAPTWPVGRYGRGLSRPSARAAAAEFDAAGAPGACVETAPFHDNPWMYLLGNTLLAHGGQAVCDRYLPRLLTGSLTHGCLLYSEPGAGSDLASLQTRAELVGEGEYLVNGQKIWTTGGQEAQFGLLLARTDWDAPKHAGLTFFVIDMDSPGIEIRPIRQITGDAEFNEVFLTDVPVPADAVIGAPGEGWRVLQVALAAERAGMGAAARGRAEGKAAAGTSDLAVLRAVADDLVEAARAAGRLNDTVVRDELVKILSWRLTNTWTGDRAAAEIRRGPSSLASLGKLAASRVLHAGTDFAYRMQGRASLVYDVDDPLAYPVDRALMFAFINSIGGGSDQIQRNIIGERVLGLPKGYEPDRGVPFRDVRKGSATRPVSQEKRP